MLGFRKGKGPEAILLLCLFLGACALGFPTSLRAQARPLTVDDLRLEVGVSSPEISPDGASIVVVTSRPNYEENRFDRTLVLVDVATGEAKNGDSST